MNILISNDDGVSAAGLGVMCDAVKGLGEITVVAPESEQSASSHAITIATPIRAARRPLDGGVCAYSVTGTPADCVKLAVREILGGKPDLVLSGVNLGSNTGISVMYSGTVSAAAEGAIMGIPGAAVSLATYENPFWETAAEAAKIIAATIIRQGLPPGVMLNVNVPNVPPAQIKGYAITKMGQSRFVEVFDRRVNPRGDVYYWLHGELTVLGEAAGTDIQALEQGYVSVTPLGIDRTRHDMLAHLEQWSWHE